MSQAKGYSKSNPPRVIPADIEELPYPTPDEPKPKRKSTTIWGIVITALGILATSVGFDNVQDLLMFLEDGFQVPQDIWPLIALFGWMLKEYGHRAATGPIQKFLPKKGI